MSTPGIVVTGVNLLGLIPSMPWRSIEAATVLGSAGGSFAGQLGSHPRCPVGLVRVFEDLGDFLVSFPLRESPRRRPRGVAVPPGVVTACGNLKQCRHPCQGEVILQRVHQFEPFGRCCFDAKKDAAFPRKRLSSRSSKTSLRKRLSSSRSDSSSAPVGSPSKPQLERSFFTQVPSVCSPRFSSLATALMLRPVSMTRPAASLRYSSVKDLRCFFMFLISGILSKTGIG